jgi:hypothetical protein
MSHVQKVTSEDNLFNYGISRHRSGFTQINGGYAFYNSVETPHPQASFLSLIRADMTRTWDLYTNGNSTSVLEQIKNEYGDNILKQFFEEVTLTSDVGTYDGLPNYGISGAEAQHVVLLDTTNAMGTSSLLTANIGQSYRIRFEFDLRQRLYLEDPDFLICLHQLNITMRALDKPLYAGGIDIDETTFAPLGRTGAGNGYDFVGTLEADGTWETYGHTGIPNPMYGWLKVNIATSMQLLSNGDITQVISTDQNELTQLSNGQYLDGSISRTPGEIVDLEFHDTVYPFEETGISAVIDMELTTSTVPGNLVPPTTVVTFTSGVLNSASLPASARIILNPGQYPTDMVPAQAFVDLDGEYATADDLANAFAVEGNVLYETVGPPGGFLFDATGPVLTITSTNIDLSAMEIGYTWEGDAVMPTWVNNAGSGSAGTTVSDLTYIPDSVNNMDGSDYLDGTYTINVTSSVLTDTPGKLIVTILNGGIDASNPPSMDTLYSGSFASTTTFEDITIHYHEIPRVEKTSGYNTIKTREKFKGRGWFKRFGKLDTNVQGTYPMSYRLTMTERGFALGLWDDAGATENDDYAWIVSQRLVNNISGETRRDSAYKYPVHCLYSCSRESLYPRDFGIWYNTGAISSHTLSNETTQVHDYVGNLHTLNHSEFNTSSGKTSYILDPFDKEDPLASDWVAKPIWRYVVREYGKLKPWDVHKSATKHETDSNAIINSMEQLAITDDNRFVITFPTGLTTQSFMYPAEEIDMICFSSAQVIGEGSTVPMTSYLRGSQAEDIDKRRYYGLRSTLPNGNGMRVCILVSGDWILNTDVNIDAHI